MTIGSFKKICSSVQNAMVHLFKQEDHTVYFKNRYNLSKSYLAYSVYFSGSSSFFAHLFSWMLLARWLPSTFPGRSTQTERLDRRMEFRKWVWLLKRKHHRSGYGIRRIRPPHSAIPSVNWCERSQRGDSSLWSVTQLLNDYAAQKNILMLSYNCYTNEFILNQSLQHYWLLWIKCWDLFRFFQSHWVSMQLQSPSFGCLFMFSKQHSIS